jgi:hypothetical protein
VSVRVEQRDVDSILRVASNVKLDNKHPVAERNEHSGQPTNDELEVVNESHSQHLGH